MVDSDEMKLLFAKVNVLFHDIESFSHFHTLANVAGRKSNSFSIAYKCSFSLHVIKVNAPFHYKQPCFRKNPLLCTLTYVTERNNSPFCESARPFSLHGVLFVIGSHFHTLANVTERESNSFSIAYKCSFSLHGILFVKRSPILFCSVFLEIRRLFIRRTRYNR